MDQRPNSSLSRMCKNFQTTHSPCPMHKLGGAQRTGGSALVGQNKTPHVTAKRTRRGPTDWNRDETHDASFVNPAERSTSRVTRSTHGKLPSLDIHPDSASCGIESAGRILDKYQVMTENTAGFN